MGSNSRSAVPPIDAAYNIFEGRVFKHDKFEAYLARNKIPWPRLNSGKLDLQAETFRVSALRHIPKNARLARAAAHARKVAFH